MGFVFTSAAVEIDFEYVQDGYSAGVQMQMHCLVTSLQMTRAAGPECWANRPVRQRAKS